MQSIHLCPLIKQSPQDSVESAEIFAQDEVIALTQLREGESPVIRGSWVGVAHTRGPDNQEVTKMSKLAKLWVLIEVRKSLTMQQKYMQICA